MISLLPKYVSAGDENRKRLGLCSGIEQEKCSIISLFEGPRMASAVPRLFVFRKYFHVVQGGLACGHQFGHQISRSSVGVDDKRVLKPRTSMKVVKVELLGTAGRKSQILCILHSWGVTCGLRVLNPHAKRPC